MPVKNQFHSPNSTFRKTLQVLITLEVDQQTKPARFSTELFVTSTSWYEKQLKTANDRQKVYYLCGIREMLYHGSKNRSGTNIRLTLLTMLKRRKHVSEMLTLKVRILSLS